MNFYLQILASFAVFFIVFLLLREFTCWYFKLTQIVELLNDIKKELHETNNMQPYHLLDEIKKDVQTIRIVAAKKE